MGEPGVTLRLGGGVGVTQSCARAVFAGRYSKTAQKTALEAVNLRKVAQGDEGVRNREKKSR